MNAPWKSGLNGRDQFAAYLCDENSLITVRAVVEELGWASEKCYKGGLRNATQSLSITASPHILLVDLSESGDPLGDINGLAEVCEPGTIVIAVGQINDVRLYRDLLASGINDYLLKPLSGPSLFDALSQAQAILSTPRNQDGLDTPHTSIAVIGTRGGVGASTLATSLAWLFSTEQSQTTALLDFDLHFGTGALTLDLEPGRGLTDAIENPSRIDGLFIERAMVRSNENLAILSAEAPISTPLLTDGAAFSQLQAEVRSAFSLAVTDMPRSMLVHFPAVISNTDVIVLVVEMTLASARDTIRILSWLKSNATEARVVIVANKVQPTLAEISKGDFEASIETTIDLQIPYDIKAASLAAKLGKTFAEANLATKPGIALRQLASLITHSDTGNLADTSKPSLLGMLDLKSIMSKAKKKAPAGTS